MTSKRPPPAAPGPRAAPAKLEVRDAHQPRAWKADTPKGRGAAPLSLGQVLVGAQAFVAQQTGAFMTQDQWRAVVGERIAKNTRVGRLTNGALQIKVSSSAWCAELSFLKPDLLEKLSRAGRDVADLKFVNEGQKKRVRVHQKAPSPELLEVVVLPPELEARLLRVDDPNLRAAIADAALHSLRAQKRNPLK